MVTDNFARRHNLGRTLRASQIENKGQIAWFHLLWNHTPEGYLRMAMAREENLFLNMDNVTEMQLCDYILQKVEYTERIDYVSFKSFNKLI